jgi:DNA-binding beta-propeller fold protein YncE
MSVPSLLVMREALTRPYFRGLETMTLALGATTGAVTTIPGYDFLDYQRRYSRPAEEPRYMLVLGPDFSATEELEVAVRFIPTPGAPVQETRVIVPPGSFPGLSFPIVLGTTVGIDLRLTEFEPRPDPPTSAPASTWRIVILLGYLAKLLWAAGWEYDHLRGHAEDVQAQRLRDRSSGRRAHGISLDYLGHDLGVQRFPPSAYSFDSNTIALYHLDEAPGAAQAADETALYLPGTTGHLATIAGAMPGRTGRFKGAFGFAGPSARLDIADDPAFALPATAGFTVEALIRPAVPTGQVGLIIGKRAQLTASNTVAGWALSVGSFRGFDNNLRLTLCDGTAETALFADRDLADGVFHHVAGTIERRPGGAAMARLVVDGREAARRRLGALGAVTNTQPVVIGRGLEQPGQDAQFEGLIDELRISSVPRASFHPVTGEGDEEYRRRLGIFERWTLPTPGAIAGAINQLVRINNSPASFLIDEDDNDVVVAAWPLRIAPKELRRRECIAADGTMRVTEAEAAGAPEDEPEFDEAWLIAHNDATHVEYGADPNNHRMQLGTARRLDALIAAFPAGPNKITISGAYDATATDLQRVGRTLLLQRTGMDASELAVRAYEAGFDFVCRTDTDIVRAGTRKSDAFEIKSAPLSPLPPRSTLGDGDDTILTLFPSAPIDAEVRWSIVRCGDGDAQFVVGSPPSETLVDSLRAKQAKLRASRPGDIAIHVEVKRRRRTGNGSLRLRIGLRASGPRALANGAAISGTGRRSVTEDQASGLASDVFDPAFLVTRAEDFGVVNPPASYGLDPRNRRMQRVVSRALDDLIAILGTGRITVERAYDAAATNLHKEGRALQLRYSVAGLAGAQELAALAFGSGFDFIRIDQSGATFSVHVSTRAGELIGIGGGAHSLRVDGATTLSIEPRARPAAVCFSPDGAHAFVADEGNDLVTRLDVAGAAATLPTLAVSGHTLVAHGPVAICPDPVNNFVYVANAGSNSVSAVERTTLAVQSFGQNLSEPRAIAVTGNRLYVACAGDATVREYDTGTQGQVLSIPAGTRPTGLAITPNGLEVWVANQMSQNLTVIDTGTNLPSTIALPGTRPVAVAFSPNGVTAYVACAEDAVFTVNQVVPITVATHVVGAPITVTRGPAALAVTASRVYAICRGGGEIDIIDPAAGPPTTVIVPLRRAPSGIGLSPAGAPYLPVALVTAADGCDVTLLDLSAVGTPRSPIVSTVVLGSGIGDHVSWAAMPLGRGKVELSSIIASTITLKATAPGTTLIRASYVLGGKTNPYEFAVRLDPVLDPAGGPKTEIRKDQYDIVMNILNSFHPIGVEVRTDDLRDRVVEVRRDFANAFPGYTYPGFRGNAVDPEIITQLERTD